MRLVAVGTRSPVGQIDQTHTNNVSARSPLIPFQDLQPVESEYKFRCLELETEHRLDLVGEEESCTVLIKT